MFDLWGDDYEVEVKLTLAAKENGVSVSEMASEMASEIRSAITASGCLSGLEWLKSDEAGHLMDLITEVEKHITTKE